MDELRRDCCDGWYMTSQRAAVDVLEAHLVLRERGRLQEDLEMNYAEDVMLFCGFGVLLGRQAERESARRLGLQLPGASFEFPIISGAAVPFSC